MKTGEAIKSILKVKQITQAILGDRLGGISHIIINQRLAQKNISMKLAADMLRVLDYKIVIVPRDTRLPDGCYEVES